VRDGERKTCGVPSGCLLFLLNLEAFSLGKRKGCPSLPASFSNVLCSLQMLASLPNFLIFCSRELLVAVFQVFLL
jgi:hypothetical protein